MHLKVLVSVSCCREDGWLFQALGPAHENERCPNFRHVCVSLTAGRAQTRTWSDVGWCHNAVSKIERCSSCSLWTWCISTHNLNTIRCSMTDCVGLWGSQSHGHVDQDVQPDGLHILYPLQRWSGWPKAGQYCIAVVQSTEHKHGNELSCNITSEAFPYLLGSSNVIEAASSNFTGVVLHRLSLSKVTPASRMASAHWTITHNCHDDEQLKAARFWNWCVTWTRWIQSTLDSSTVDLGTYYCRWLI